MTSHNHDPHTDDLHEDAIEPDTGRPQPARASAEDRARARQLALAVADALDDAKCEDIIVLGVHGFSQITDYVVIASGSSERQLRAAAHRAMDAGEELGQPPYNREGEHTVGWVVIDFIDVMVHLFEPHTRALYDLEMLWGDAERVPFTPTKKSAAASTDRAPGA
ncbi:MAG: ribosome silencing factor [Phycisphaeraceae bacterium]|nr:ribosome silencing factor [Phycisphaeraceae bacterium]MCB9848107.1 ribosome silencing factor [Phycisphaeraceae bacterium]